MRRRSLFDNNLFVRLISVVLGFLLWVVVSFSSNSQGTGLATTTQVLHNIPVIVLTSPQMMATSERPVRVNLSVSGSIFDVATVQADSSGIRAVANATTMGPGKHQVPIIIENSPSSAVTYVPETPYAEVNIQERVASPFSLNVKVVGKPQAGMRLGLPISSNNQIVVSGPDALVHQVTAVKALVDVTGSTDSVTRMVPVLPVNKNGQVVQGVFCNPETVTISVPVLSPVHQLQLVPFITGQPAAKWSVASVSITPSSISVTGPLQAKLPSYLTLPPVDVARLTHSKTFTVAIPAPFNGAKLSVPVAQVRVELAPKGSTTLQGIPIKIMGNTRGHQFTIQGPQFVRLTITGADSELENFQSQDVSVYVDVSGLKLNKPTMLPVTVVVPSYLSVAKVLPDRVAVVAMK